ncbi:ABC-type nitrate/sulfonate/bicarbonate transport system, substrate-binding protein [Natronincola peptidivorans]|uniref:ABC-type nitrate/sulfonate/bicarbonate transport system, substrate-binding protein n=1 Tax=Natronincola peptidivorans TaxID=426128 RepID=A0A1I0A8B8_9FIRM|nr:ABC transporter substrate-binding protein [Natronincola peptidivorans]SES89941.1 ABC-type nitrate/sulfonate/bicarbonate transport system, substrate-binding protein [Natronincola peptidivorans]
MKKYFVVFMVLTLLMTSIVGCSTETEGEAVDTPAELDRVTVILDWVPNTNHTGMYTAIERGFYAEEGLEVEIIQPTEGGSADLIAAGQGEFGISYQEQVAYARTAESPLPVKAIAAIIQHNTSGFASPADKEIISPRDFEGKRYGGWGSPMEEAMLKALMDKDGGDFSQLEMVDIGALDFFASVEGHVDFTWIYYGWDGIAAELRDYDLNFILLQDVHEALDFYTPVIIAQEGLLEASPELAERFLKATTKGYEYAIENPEEAAEDLLKWVPELDREMVIASQRYLADQYQADAARWGEMKLEVWEKYSNWMYEQGLLREALDAEAAFTNQYLPQ